MSRRNSRDEIDRAFGDAVYDAWRRGLDSDAVDRERVAENYYNTYDLEQAASMEVNRIARATRARQEEREQEQWPEQEYPEEEVEDCQ